LPFLKEGNKIKRIAFNLFKKGYSLSNTIKQIQSSYNIAEYIDQSTIKFFSQQAEGVYNAYTYKNQKKLIFGSLVQWKRFQKGLITLEEFSKIKNTQLLLFVGSHHDYKGNRKFELDISNNQIIFKQTRSIHHFLKLNTSKRTLKILEKLQVVSETIKTPISYRLSDTHIHVCFDESVLKEREHSFISERIGSLDLNPNYIAFTIQDFNNKGSKIVYKEVINLTALNNNHNTDKSNHELLESSKRIANLAKHYKCEIVGSEKLDMLRKDHGRGKLLNRLINNTWNRNIFINNLKKRLNILGIKNQEVAPQYSSTIGCLNHPEETDSIAAALEIGRRTYMFKKKFLDKDKHFLDKDIIYPTLDYKTIRERWNSILGEYNPKRVGWVGIHNYLKEKKKLTELRFLFKDYDFSSWSCCSLKSDKSLVSVNGTKLSCFK